MPRTPHSPELKRQAVELFQKGAEVKAIADLLKLPIRTIYRWVDVYKSVRTIEPETISSDPRFQKLVQLQKMSHAEACAWLDSIEETVDRHGNIHLSLIEDLTRLLKQAMEADNISPRSVNVLSQALCRHMDGERQSVLMGRQQQVDIGQAMATVMTYGWMVLKNDRWCDLEEGDT
ncbi:MAG: helix-turn-helix domain-containing protein [Nostoc sp.]